MAQRISHERLAQAAIWYYVHDLGQEEVARRLRTSRSNVSRMLRAAREEGIIRFQIAYPTRRDLDMEHQLHQRFAGTALREVVITSPSSRVEGPGSEQTGVLAVAQSAAEWLDTNLRDGQTVGLFWGGAVRAMVDVVHFNGKRDVHVVQLAGEWSNDPKRSGHDLVRELGLKLSSTYTYFNAPAFAATPADADALLAEPQVAASLALARSADLCLLGVGAFLAATTAEFLQQANATEAEIEEARAKGVVGQLGGRFFDSSGKQADLEIHRRLVSLDLNELREAQTILVMASGTAKREAVLGALRGGLIDVLIVDAGLANALLHL